jgi:hypothetical protein
VTLLLAIVAAAVAYGKLSNKVDSTLDTLKDQVKTTDAVKDRVSVVETNLAGVRADLSNVRDDTQGIRSLQRKTDAIWAKVNQEVIPRLNALNKKAPPIQPAQVSAILDNQQKTLARVADIDQKVGVVSKQAAEIADDQWRYGDHVLSPLVQRAAVDALKPIRVEWMEAIQRQRETGKPPVGSGFVPAGVMLATEPEVHTTVSGGIAFVDGFVPSESAKRIIVAAVEKVGAKRVVSDNLKVKP